MRFPVIAMNTADAAVSDGTPADATAALAPDPVVQEATPSDQTPEPVATEPKPEVKEKAKPWFLERIAEESAKARQAQERLDAAERRAREAEALAERLRMGKDTQPDQPRYDRQPQPTLTNEQIRAEAERLRFHDDTVEVRNAGMAKFGAAFGESLNILGHLGITTNDGFVKDVLAVDKGSAHILLDQLARDPERAYALSSMSSAKRIAELVKMSIGNSTPASDSAKAAPPAKTVSKAPAPAPKVEPKASTTKDWRLEDDDAAWNAAFDAHQAERRKQRL